MLDFLTQKCLELNEASKKENDYYTQVPFRDRVFNDENADEPPPFS